MSSETTSSQYEEQRIGHGIMSELRLQRHISLPLTAMNLTWFVKLTITTAFLGRLGELELAGGILGFTFANVTGFSVLTGLSAAMEPICGQAFGAKNYKLLHKTLLMTVFLLLTASLPISLLWLYVDDILIFFGQQKDISVAAKNYLLYLLPDLVVTSLLCPLKTYLSSQNITVPVMFSSGFGLALHVPVNILLVRAKGFEGVAMAVWVTDFVVTALLGFYVMVVEKTKDEEKGGWLNQGISDWIRVLKLAGPCCLTTCLEWWCYEILVLLTGRLADAKRAVGILAIVINFDYLLYSVMLSLATCASIRVSNELGGNHGRIALRASRVSLTLSVLLGFVGAAVMVAARGSWGRLFSRDPKIIYGVEKMMLLMALLEVVNFPLAVCGGILRGTARPWLAMYANLGGFYAVALPLGVVFAFRAGLGLGGLLVGFLIGMATCLLLMLVFMTRINWDEEAKKAVMRASNEQTEACGSVNL